MPDPLATPDDLGTDAGDATPDEVQAALKRASALVRGYCRQHVSHVADDTAELVGTWQQRLWLPERPVREVSEVRLNGHPVAYRRVRDVLWASHWGGPSALVEVTYTHGHDLVPDDVVAVTVQAALRLLPGAQRAGMATQESIGDYSVTYRAATSLNAAEQAALDYYRRRTVTP